MHVLKFNKPTTCPYLEIHTFVNVSSISKCNGMLTVNFKGWLTYKNIEFICNTSNTQFPHYYNVLQIATCTLKAHKMLAV